MTRTDHTEQLRNIEQVREKVCRKKKKYVTNEMKEDQCMSLFALLAIHPAWYRTDHANQLRSVEKICAKKLHGQHKPNHRIKTTSLTST